MRTSRKPDQLLELLAREKRKNFALKELEEKLELKRNQIYKILCSLQEKGMVCIKKTITDKRKHFVTLQEENKMARLRKREIVAPSVSEMAASLKKTMFRRRTKLRVPLLPIKISDSVLEIINHWNGFECVPKLKLPNPVDGFYHNPSKRLKETVSALRKLLTGNFYSKVPIVELRELNQTFTVKEVKDTLTSYCKSAYLSNYLPYNKSFLEGKTLLDVIFYKRAAYLKDKGLFVHFYHNPPELTPVMAAQKIKMEKENLKDQKLQKTDRDEETLGYLEEELILLYDKYYKIENEQERTDLKKVSVILYDFAEQHGGLHSVSKWAWYAIDALMWRKEKGGRFNAFPKTMLQDWFYNSVMIDYFIAKGLDNHLYLPEIHGEVEPISYSDQVISKEEGWKEYWD